MAFSRSSKTSPQAVRAALIEAGALKLRSEGRNYEEIGLLLGVKPAAANAAVRRALARAKKELVENSRETLDLELYRLDQLFYHAMRHVQGGDARAIREALAVMDRRAKYLGLDAAIKADFTVNAAEPKLGALSEADLQKIEAVLASGQQDSADMIDLDEAPDYGEPTEGGGSLPALNPLDQPPLGWLQSPSATQEGGPDASPFVGPED